MSPGPITKCPSPPCSPQTAQVEAQAEALENRHKDYKNRQGLPAAAGTYKNRISKTIDDDGKAA
ncbi:hypothetical protein, partial [Polycladidibacter hongkongensis]|uniref:hypothetical protein n=1 Tax=Polycladidibacter hongkongensis TaxID=1647556 RepID=UPI001AD920CD